MPKYRITAPDGQTYEVNAPDGASEAEVMAYAQRSFKMAAAPKAAPSKPFGEQVNEAIADVPRALGRFGRVGLQGAGNLADMFATPFREGLNLIPGVDIKPGGGAMIADALNLPKPRPGMEAASDQAAEMLVGGGGIIRAGNALANGASGTTQAVGKMLASNPGAQLTSAAAAGGAGGYTRETGGNDGAQLLASLAAGIAAPFGVNGAIGLGNAARRMLAPKGAQPVNIDITINNALRESGMTLADLPADVARSIRADVGKAMGANGVLSPDAIRRLADYRQVGATPTMAGLTLDPAIVSQQKNLAKLGINSKDPAAQALGQVAYTNNNTLIGGLNRLGAGSADDTIGGAQKIMGGVSGYDDRATSIIGRLYDRAKTGDGRSAALDPQAFATKADELLTFNLRNAELPADIRNKLNSFASGETPLTVETAEQFKTILAKVQRSSSDGGVRDAISHVRTALDQTPLLPGQPLGARSQAAFDRARSMHRQYMGIVEKTPALQAVRDGIEPDKFVQQFVIGNGGKSNVMDVAMLKNSIKGNPEAMSAVKTQITSFLKSKALNGAADEVGNFSQSGYNKALEAIGERKLRLFFSPQEINQMKALGRVASYEQFQPTGAAVNNSNTASAGMSAVLDRIGGSALLSKVPLGRLVQEPAQNMVIGMQSQRAMDPAQALIDRLRLPQPNDPALMLSPAAFMYQPQGERR